MKISKSGLLRLNKRGQFCKQYCPFSFEKTRCGDWCPHFGELEWSKNGSTAWFELKCVQNNHLLLVDLPSRKVGSIEMGYFAVPKEFIDERDSADPKN